MANSPIWKVYDAERQYQGCTKEIEAAAALVAFYGPNSTIRLRLYGHSRVVWHESLDGTADDSYDTVAQVAYRRAFKKRA